MKSNQLPSYLGLLGLFAYQWPENVDCGYLCLVVTQEKYNYYAKNFDAVCSTDNIPTWNVETKKGKSQ